MRRDSWPVWQVLRLMAEAVHRYQGTVNQFLGDGLMALFGAPVALEDHALRAVEAALTIRETIAGYAETLHERGVDLQLRLGLNTGLVVVGRIGDDLRMDYTAVGGTTNLAARLQALAEPGTILVSEAVYRLVEGHVHHEALDPVTVKGVNAPVRPYRITGRRRLTRLEVSAERGLSRLVGRRRELDLLRERFARARDGRGQIVGIVGEPGIGKSRLVYEFRRSLEGERIAWLAGHCVAWGKATPWLPILENLRGNFHLEDDDNPLQIEAKLRSGLRALDPVLEAMLPSLRDLFCLPMEADASPQKLDPQAQREKTFEAIRALVVAGSQQRPLVLVVEDLHWIDTASEDFLAFLAESMTGLPVLLLTTHRPGYAARWADKTAYTQIALDPLEEADTAALVRSLLGVERLPDMLVRLVQDKAEGNPLFVEEITRSLLERSLVAREAGEAHWAGAEEVDVPETAQGIIRARIDGLAEPVKRTAQAAAIGREFGVGLLVRVADEPSAVPACLAALKQAELVHEKSFFPEVEYTFKHALIQDVVYQSILLRRRKELHRAIGQAIEGLYAEHLPEHYALLAHHFVLAEDRAKAFGYLVKAGDRATTTAAYREASGSYRCALDFAEEGDLRARAETLHKLSMMHFFAGDLESGIRYSEEALALYEQLGDKPGLLAINLETMRVFTGGARDGSFEDRAIPHLHAAAALMERDPDTIDKGLVYQRLGHLYMHRGEYARTLEWAERAQEVFRHLSMSMGTSVGTAMTYLGRTDEGLAYNEKNWEPVAKSRNWLIVSVLGHELTTTLALLRDPRAAIAAADRALAILPAGATGMSPGMQTIIRRPLVLACVLAGETARAQWESEIIRDIERRTFYGCVFEDGAAVALHEFARGESEIALAYLEQVMPVLQQRNLVAAMNASGFVRGCVELAQGNARNAVDWLGRSLEICRRGGSVLFELWVLPVLAEAYLALGESERAAEHVDRGLALLAPGRDWCGLPAPLHRARGMVAIAHGRRDEAERALDAALAVSRQHGLAWDEARTVEVHARLKGRSR